MNDLISVIVPIYGVEKYLDKCIQSIVDQTHKNLEIILVDDGSPDNCPQMCDQWAQRDSRIRVIHRENGGIAAARNSGLEVATGEYIGFIDSDDYIHPRMYELLYQRLIEDQSDIACCNWIAVEEGEDTCEDDILSFCQSECYQNNGAGFAGWRKNFDFSACNKVYRRNHLCGLRFDETVRFGEDSIFCTQVICRAQSVSKVEVPLYYYLRRLGSLSKTEDVLIYLETIACWDKLCVDHSESFLMVVDIQAALINRASSMLVFPKKYRGMTEEKYRYSCRMLRKHANVASLKGVGSPLRRLQTITAYISPTLARWLGGLLKETGKF